MLNMPRIAGFSTDGSVQLLRQQGHQDRHREPPGGTGVGSDGIPDSALQPEQAGAKAAGARARRTSSPMTQAGAFLSRLVLLFPFNCKKVSGIWKKKEKVFRIEFYNRP